MSAQQMTVRNNKRAQLGTAEWMDPAEIASLYPYQDGKVWLGRCEKEEPIGYSDDRHVLLTVGGRGGKGASFITNNLVLWPGSIVVLDPKGENATVTARRRAQGSEWSVGLGQTLRILDPFGAAHLDEGMRSRFNPLDALDVKASESIDEVFRIADALVVQREEGDPFWDESAREMIRGLIMHVMTAPEFEGERTLLTVRKLIAGGDWKAVETLRNLGKNSDEIASPQALLWDAVSKNQAFAGLVADIGAGFASLLADSAKTFENVRQTARRHTEFMDSPGMQWMLSGSDFKLSELKTRKEGMSLYLCLPSRFMNTHFRWLRMMISLTLSEVEKVPGRPASGHPILMMLDEFSALKRMPVIENALDRIAGFGVKMCFVLQSLSQLKDIYKDRWETFPANCGLKIFFNNEDHFTREYASKLIGETETIRDTHSHNEAHSRTEGSSVSAGQSVSTSHSTTNGTSNGGSRTKSWTKGQTWSDTHSDTASIGGGVSQTSTKGPFGWGPSSLTKGENWSMSHTHTSSRGGSFSETEGEGTNWNESHSETKGDSASRSLTLGRSTSQGWTGTNGLSEAVHKRALTAPDEIGRIFGTVTDRSDARYPGFALVLIAGRQPAVVRRVNYFEDEFFVCCFDPHPDHEFRAPEFMRVTAGEIGECARFLETGLLETFRREFLQNGEHAPMPAVLVAKACHRPGDRVEPRTSVLRVRVGNQQVDLTAGRRGMVKNAAEQDFVSASPSTLLLKSGYYTTPPSLREGDCYRSLFHRCLEKRDALKRRIKVAAGLTVPGLAVAGESLYRLSIPMGALEIAGLCLSAAAASIGYLCVNTLAACPRRILHDRRPVEHMPQAE